MMQDMEADRSSQQLADLGAGRRVLRGLADEVLP